MLRWSRKRKGFTLVELVIVIAILGILAMYALPKYEGVVEEARSSEARAQLGAVRSALGIYYAKNHGQYPATLDETIFSEGTVPEVEVTVSGVVKRNNAVKNISNDGKVTHDEVSNDGGWIYDVSDGKTGDPAKNTVADVRLNSTDEDPADSNTEGKDWYQY